jgi:predicted GNAT family acetyltransferase
MSQPIVERVDAIHHYELRLDGEVVGFANYRDDGERRVFVNTQVSDELAPHLIVGALTDLKQSKKRFVCLCPVFAEYVLENHEFENFVDGPAVLEKGRSSGPA